MLWDQGDIDEKVILRDCVIIIRRGGGGGAEKIEGGLHKIAAKIGGLKVKSHI